MNRFALWVNDWALFVCEWISAFRIERIIRWVIWICEWTSEIAFDWVSMRVSEFDSWLSKCVRNMWQNESSDGCWHQVYADSHTQSLSWSRSRSRSTWTHASVGGSMRLMMWYIPRKSECTREQWSRMETLVITCNLLAINISRIGRNSQSPPCLKSSNADQDNEGIEQDH